MAKKTTTKPKKTIEDSIETVKEEIIETPIKKEKRTLCYLASKANHIIEILYNNKVTYIQPFGKIKVIKEKIKVSADDAKYLTFIKI